MFSGLTQWLLAVLVGGAAGILSGFGVGGGTLLLVYLTAVLDMEQQMAQGINLLYFLPAAAMALPIHWRNGYVEKRALLPAVAAGLLCAGIGAWVAVGLDTGLLRRCFGGFLVFIGINQMRRKEKKQRK